MSRFVHRTNEFFQVEGRGEFFQVEGRGAYIMVWRLIVGVVVHKRGFAFYAHIAR